MNHLANTQPTLPRVLHFVPVRFDVITACGLDVNRHFPMLTHAEHGFVNDKRDAWKVTCANCMTVDGGVV